MSTLHPLSHSRTAIRLGINLASIPVNSHPTVYSMVNSYSILSCGKLSFHFLFHGMKNSHPVCFSLIFLCYHFFVIFQRTLSPFSLPFSELSPLFFFTLCGGVNQVAAVNSHHFHLLQSITPNEKQLPYKVVNLPINTFIHCIHKILKRGRRTLMRTLVERPELH